MSYGLKLLPCLAVLLSLPNAGRAAWPFTNEGVRKHSDEYYEMRACEPIGERQKCHHGKMWPPYPRPAGDPLPMIHRYHASKYWPYPYSGMDEAEVRAVIATQIMNGWEACTTLYDYHFDPVTHELNSSGQAHLVWIMSNVPVEHRKVSIATAMEPGKNNLRMAYVQAATARLVGSDQSLPIVLRVATPPGRPAQEVDAIFKARMEKMESPVIPFSVQPTGTGGASSGG